ncbi:MAG: hypothetical protein K1X31_14775 [Gemmatimonadaceae bacterium]|nr:hypothetical protein [Gemmatimonadaceae bacterium]
MSRRPPLRPIVLLLAACGAAACAAACAPAAPGAGGEVGAPSPAVVREPQMSGTTQLLIAVHPVSASVAWASGGRGTWTRTTDGGRTWVSGRVTGADSLQFRDVHALDATTAWLLSIGPGAQSRIYRTDDGGAQWHAQFVNPDPKGFYDCFAFWDAARAVAIGDAIDGAMAVLRTEDGGQHWTRVPPERLPRANAGEGSFAASGTCAATGPGGRAWLVMSTPSQARLLRTADYGRTWALETLPITTHEGSGPQSVLFRDARHGLVVGGGYASRPGDTLVAATDDGGDTWRAVGGGPPFKVGSWGAAWIPGARVPTVLAVGPNGSAWSRDGGTTWVVLDTLNYWSVGAASPTAAWAVGTQGRITRSGGW